MGKNDIIELNGKQYDAVTGSLLGESLVKATPTSRPRIAHHGRSVDGFTHSSIAAPRTNQPVKKTVVAKHLSVQRTEPQTITAHKPQRPMTLMRHIVKKPVVTLKPHIKPSSPTGKLAEPLSEIARPLERKLAAAQINPVRLAHANHVARSQHIHKFSTARPQANLQVLPFDQQRSVRPQISTPNNRAGSLITVPPRANMHQVFEHAVAQAKSHEESPQKSSGRRAIRRRKAISFAAGIAALLVIGSFIAYLNAPAIEVRIASVQAGFHASLPAYTPTGYSLANGINASKNTVAFTYHSGDSSYTITQTASNWDSDTLLDQEQGAPVQTVQSEGRLIYIYHGDTTWVNGGILYTITGNASLSTNELVSLATSM